MMLKTVFMFSGQGSQYYQMGRALFDGSPTFRRWMLSMDAHAQDLCGQSIVHLLYRSGRDKSEPFTRTLLTGPAIFMVEVALAKTLIEADVWPDIVLGSSLGTFAAAATAGCISVEDGLSAIVELAVTLEARCPPGGMIAVLAEPSLHDNQALRDSCEVAAVNFDSHFVISAPADRLPAIERFLGDRRVVFQRLPVAIAYHSRWVEPARSALLESLSALTVHSAKLPIACCAHVELIAAMGKDYFWEVLRRPIEFHAMAMKLEAMGACRFVDVGPAATLATLLRYILPRGTASQVQSILNPLGDGLQKLAAVTGHTEPVEQR